MPNEDGTLTDEEREQIEAIHEERKQRLTKLLDAKVIDPSDLIALRVAVLVDFSVPDFLRPIMDVTYNRRLDEYLTAAEEQHRKSTLTKGVTH